MSLCGRPKIGSGHESLNISIESDLLKKLNKVSNKSAFIEKSIRPPLNQLDPGDSCPFLNEVDQKAQLDLYEAVRKKDYEKVATIGQMMDSWKDYRLLCADNRAECENAGGVYENGTCQIKRTKRP